ncbi:MAG TPA: ABC transporter permease [Gemmatimonadales bacterium]|nr:ABC transporter permease [Gemmatimonadales bacterium]
MSGSEPGGWRRALRFWRSDVRQDVDEELRFHLEMHQRELAERGHSPLAARQEAERRFGELGRIREECVAIDTRQRQRAERREIMGDLWQDVRFALRTLRKSPGFALAAILCIGLGIGVTTTIVSAVHAILIRPLPYENAGELVSVYVQDRAQDEHRVNISYPDYVSWRDDSRSFAALGMWTWQALAFSGEGEPERLEGAMVTANLFPLLGVRPFLGRTFLAEEETVGRNRVVLLSHGLWRRRYGGDSSVVNRTITVDGTPYLVAGVMPPGFAFPERGEAWVPFAVDPARQSRGNRMYAGALGRLRPGTDIAQARRDLELLSARLKREFPEDNDRWEAEAIPLRDDLVGDMRRPLMIFLGGVGFVLLIVCANVANLILTRGAGRRREIAVRTAIGAHRGRLVRQLLTESLVLASLGGLVGVGVAAIGVKLFSQAVPDGLPWYVTFRLDGSTLLITLLLAALTGVLFGLVPAFKGSGANLTTGLREGTGGSGEGRERSRLRGTLVVVEVALSLILMVGAVLLLRSYRALTATELGFTPRGVLTFRISLPRAQYPEEPQRFAFYTELFQRTAAIPGVEAVGSAQGIPQSGWNVAAGFSVEGRPEPRQGEELVAHYQYITPGYFPTLEVSMISGRNLALTDRDTLNPVGVINESMAKLAFPGENPLGKRLKYGGVTSTDPWITIVGVARDIRHYRLPEPMRPAIYLPFFEWTGLTQTVTVRAAGDLTTLLTNIRGVVRSLDADLPLFQVQTLEEAMARSLWRPRLQSRVLGIFAGLAMVLATMGIYGVISYAVAQRTRELGVRVALGASRRQVVALVVTQGVRLALIGVTVGLAGALILTRVLSRLLYGVQATDTLTFIAVPLVLGAVAVVATWIPALRAARVDPLISMRAE